VGAQETLPTTEAGTIKPPLPAGKGMRQPQKFPASLATRGGKQDAGGGAKGATESSPFLSIRDTKTRE